MALIKQTFKLVIRDWKIALVFSVAAVVSFFWFVTQFEAETRRLIDALHGYLFCQPRGVCGDGVQVSESPDIPHELPVGSPEGRDPMYDLDRPSPIGGGAIQKDSSTPNPRTKSKRPRLSARKSVPNTTGPPARTPWPRPEIYVEHRPLRSTPSLGYPVPGYCVEVRRCSIFVLLPICTTQVMFLCEGCEPRIYCSAPECQLTNGLRAVPCR